MNTEDEHLLLKLIATIFDRFAIQTRFSRDYFERFCQLLKQTFEKHSELKPAIETSISSIISPSHPSNLVIFEYQLRLIRFSLRQHLQIIELTRKNFLDELFHQSLLVYSSILRHLSLQIAILIYEDDLQQSFDANFFSHIIELFASDPNLYVRNTLAQFLALYLSKHDQYPLLDQIRNSDLIYDILVLLNQDQQQSLIKQLNIYENLSDTTATRVFVLKTAKYLIDESPIVVCLNRVFEKSLSDYVHMLFSIISSRTEHHRSSLQLIARVKALFLYIEQTEFEEIDENETDNHEDELTEYLCCQLYERNVQSTDLASMILDTIQPSISNGNSFIYKLEFYPFTVEKLLIGEIENEKNFAQLIVCADRLREFGFLVKNNLCDIIIEQVKSSKRTAPVYQSLFDLILNSTNRMDYLESIGSIVEILLFQDTDQVLQWDKKDCVLHFLIRLSQTTKTQFPSWFTNEFLRRIIETFVHNTNEYIQGSLIDFLATVIEHALLSPLDQYLTSNFIQLTQYSLGDVVRCALAHAWFIILTKSNAIPSTYPLTFGSSIDRDSLLNIIIAQVPLLIGDGGHETELQCLRLIESLGMRSKELETVLEFLLHDGCSKEIKDHAARLLSIANDVTSNEILEDEFRSILHWLEHPDEHMILDCD